MAKQTKWTKTCPFYKQAVIDTAFALGITEKEVHKTIMSYLFRCKQLIMQGHKVQFPGIIFMQTYKAQLGQIRKFMTYAQLKRRYGDTEYFKKYTSKSNKK